MRDLRCRKAEQYKHHHIKCSGLQWVSVSTALCSPWSVKQQRLKLKSSIEEKLHSKMQAKTTLKSPHLTRISICLSIYPSFHPSIPTCENKLTLSHQGISLQKRMPGLIQRPSTSSNRDHRNHESHNKKPSSTPKVAMLTGTIA